MSPGPETYSPKREITQKKSKTVIFTTERRGEFINRDKQKSPGPGAYKIPCRFYDRPAFMLKTKNHFRFV